MTSTELPRNDTGAALAFAREEMLAGAWSADTAETLAMLQDRPDALVAELVSLRLSLGLPAPSASALPPVPTL